LVTVWRERECVVKMGELLMQEVFGPSTAVRAAAVARKPGKLVEPRAAGKRKRLNHELGKDTCGSSSNG